MEPQQIMSLVVSVQNYNIPSAWIVMTDEVILQ